MFFLTEIQIKLNANAALLSPNSKKVLFQSLWGGVACPHCVCVGSVQVVQCPPTVQSHAFRR